MQALSIEANKVLNNIFAPYPRSLFPYFGSKLSVSTGERLLPHDVPQQTCKCWFASATHPRKLHEFPHNTHKRMKNLDILNQ